MPLDTNRLLRKETGSNGMFANFRPSNDWGTVRLSTASSVHTFLQNASVTSGSVVAMFYHLLFHGFGAF